MGIATALIYSWQNGTSQPDDQQLKALAGFFLSTMPLRNPMNDPGSRQPD